MLRKAAAFLSVYYAHMTVYRGEILFWLLSGLAPFFFMAIWVEAARHGLTDRDPLAFARYFFFIFVARQLQVVWVTWTLSEEIKNGLFAFKLLQPLDPFWHYLAQHLAERGVRLPMILVLLAVFLWLYPGALVFSGWGPLFLGLLASLLGFLLNFFVAYALGLLALWLEEATDLYEAWYVFFMLFSGYLAPLDLYPAPVREALFFTPFPHLAYLPASLFAGVQVERAGLAFLVLILWTLLFYLVSRWLWQRGLKQFSAMGA